MERLSGERYVTILKYFWPEFITALVLYALPHALEARFIANLRNTSLYITLGVTSTLFHFVTKMAEGLSVGTIITCGQYNGAQEFKQVGRAVAHAFWITFFIGACIATCLYIGAYQIYRFYGLSSDVLEAGIPYLRLRAVSIFLMFVYFALIGFLRGIKNTKIPMVLFMVGGSVFLFFDYALINGVWGFARMELQGSAVAAVIQYSVMVVGALAYILGSSETRRYSITLLPSFDWSLSTLLLSLSWPVMIDKAALALAKIWLARLIAPLGETALASFTVIKDVSQFAFIPAVAFTQVVTLLVSNDYALGDWQGIKDTIKKILGLSLLMVGLATLVLSVSPASIIRLFDPEVAFTEFAARAFPWLGILVLLDVLQLLLAGALRGAGDVKTVMKVRLANVLGYLVPISLCIAALPFQSTMLKFVLLYASFYGGDGLMGGVYIRRLRGDAWKHQSTVTL